MNKSTYQCARDAVQHEIDTFKIPVEPYSIDDMVTSDTNGTLAVFHWVNMLRIFTCYRDMSDDDTQTAVERVIRTLKQKNIRVFEHDDDCDVYLLMPRNVTEV